MGNLIVVLKTFLIFFCSLLVLASDVESRIDDIDLRLTDVELKFLNTKFSLSGEFTNHWETYAKTVYTDGNTKGHSLYVFATLLELNINFILTKNLSFYSRLGMSKFWNNENNPTKYERSETSDSWDTSNQGSFGYWGSSPKFDRAYMTYSFFDKKAAFSIGRMATHKGPPEHQQFGDNRTGTYPRLVYNSIFDGAAITYYIKNLVTRDDNFSISFFYTPFVNVSKTVRDERRKEKDINGNEQVAKPLTPQYTVQAEYSNKITNIFTYNFIYFYYNYTDFFTYTDASDDDEDDIILFDSNAHSLYLGLENILNKRVNFNISYLRLREYETTMSSSAKAHYKGYAWLGGLNINIFRNIIVGTEYIHTSPDYYVDDRTYYTISDFYRVANNKGIHLFTSFPVFDLTRLKIGVFDYKTNGSTSIDSDNAKKNVRSVYATLKTSF